jgi:hypothetical protein
VTQQAINVLTICKQAAFSTIFTSRALMKYARIPMRLREFRGLAPQSVFGGLALQNHLTMVIILPLSLPSTLPPLPLSTNIKKID